MQQTLPTLKSYRHTAGHLRLCRCTPSTESTQASSGHTLLHAKPQPLCTWQEAIAAQAIDVSVMATCMQPSTQHLLYHPAHADPNDVPESHDHACLRLQEAIAAQAMDVEDLAKQGRAKGTCPYYAARAAAASADLVLMPYSTLLSQVCSCLCRSGIIFEHANAVGLADVSARALTRSKGWCFYVGRCLCAF